MTDQQYKDFLEKNPHVKPWSQGTPYTYEDEIGWALEQPGNGIIAVPTKKNLTFNLGDGAGDIKVIYDWEELQRQQQIQDEQDKKITRL